jgi:hypothetical protein
MSPVEHTWVPWYRRYAMDITYALIILGVGVVSGMVYGWITYEETP